MMEANSVWCHWYSPWYVTRVWLSGTLDKNGASHGSFSFFTKSFGWFQLGHETFFHGLLLDPESVNLFCFCPFSMLGMQDTGFPLTERDRLGLRGLLPPRVISFEQQYDRFSKFDNYFSYIYPLVWGCFSCRTSHFA